MRSAISPLTPVSISSKMMVGKVLAAAMSDLMESMRRLISPPEATSPAGLSGWFLLAENMKLMSSRPEGEKLLSGAISTLNRTFGIPRYATLLTRAFSKLTAAFLRESVRMSASRLVSAVSFFSLASSSAISSSLLSMLSIFSASESRKAISSAMLSH